MAEQHTFFALFSTNCNSHCVYAAADGRSHDHDIGNVALGILTK